MANVTWNALERKALLTLTCNLFSYLRGQNCTISAPVWGMQELLFPLVLAGSDRTCAKGFESEVSPQYAEDVDVCVWGGWVNWESMALVCSTSRTHDIAPVMSIASSNIKDIPQCEELMASLVRAQEEVAHPVQDSTAVSVGTMGWSILLLSDCALLPCYSHYLHAWMCIFYSPHCLYSYSCFQDCYVLSRMDF